MELKKIKNFKWQVSLFALIVFCFNLIPFPMMSIKAETQLGAVRNPDGTVTISVEMAKKDGEYVGDKLFVKGAFDGWTEFFEMSSEGNNIYSYTTEVLAPGSYEYKFSTSGEGWVNDFNQNGELGGSNSVVTIKPLGVTLNGDNTATFRVEDPLNGNELYLVGDITNDNWQSAIAMTKGTDDVFEVTVNVEPGKNYQYKYKYTSDMSDWDSGSFNQEGGTASNSLLKVPGEAKAYAPILNGDGTVTFTFKDLSASAVYLAGPFGSDYNWQAQGLALEQDEETKLWSITINPNKLNPSYVDGSVIQYKYVVNGTSWVLDPNNDEVVGGNSAFTYYMFSDAVSPVINPNETIVFSYNNPDASEVYLAGNITGWADGKLSLTKNENGIWTICADTIGMTEIEYKFIVDGNWITDPANEQFNNGNSFIDTNATGNEEVKKVIVKYVRPNKDYDGWTIHTWSTGKKDGDFEFKVENGIGIAEIPVGDSTTAIGFKIRKDNTWTEVDYNSDRYISVDKSALVTKATVTQGKGEILVVPSVKEVEINNGQIDFQYRNLALYNENKQDTIESVKLMIKDTSSDFASYDMTYDDLKEYFSYAYKNIKEGTYTYKFAITVDGETTYTDEKNIECKKRSINGTATFMPKEITYTENSVVSLKLEGADANADSIRSIYMDLTSVGGRSNTPMDVNVLENGVIEQTIGVEDTVTAGTKNIPITIVDINGEVHKTSASIIIKTKVATNDNLDFGFDEARVYFTVTDRFLNGNKSNDDPNGNNYDQTAPYTYHGGDFAGLTEKIDYLKDLGINTIWITPIVEQTDFDQMFATNGGQYSYHGYWAKDFTVLDPHLGTMEEFKNLIDKAHDNGIKIMVDVVINHAGYGMDNAATGSEGVNNYPTDTDRSVFEGMLRGEDGGDIFTSASSGLPDFKTEDLAVRTKLIQWQVDWLERAKTDKGNSIDYFRIDTVKHVEDATWKSLKNALTKVNQEFKVIGEYYGADINTDGGQLESGQMDALLDFGYKSYAKSFVNGSLESTSSILDDRASRITNTYLLGQFLSSHDEDGFITALDGDAKDEITDGDRALAYVAASLQITDKGIPVIYYGEELGLSGANDFEAGDPNRYDMDFSLLETETGSKSYNHYKTLLNIRDKYSKVFAKGDRKTLVADDSQGYTVYTRNYNNTSILTVLNIKDSAKEVDITVKSAAGSKIKDLYSGKEYSVDSKGNATITVPAAANGGTSIFAYVTDANEAEKVVVSNNGKVNIDVLKDLANSSTKVEAVISVNEVEFIAENIAGLIAQMEASGITELEIKTYDVIENIDALGTIDKFKGVNLIGQIRFESNLKDGDLGGNFRFNISVGEEYNGKTLYLYYINEKGEYIFENEFVVKNGIFTGVTDHFSDFVILDSILPSAEGEKEDTNKPSTGKNNSSSSSNSTKTGDNNNNLVFGLVALFVVSGMFITFSRKKEEA